MILGFISLLLTFGQNYITQICIPEEISRTMLPCNFKESHDGLPAKKPEGSGGDHHRRLLWNERRILATDSPGKGCEKVTF